MPLKLARCASRDLEAIHVGGCERFGLIAADRYLDGLWETLQFLAENPRAARERHEIDPPMRAYPYRSHLIVYDVEGDEVTITRIPHARSDWSSEP